ncbi:MAG: hypothetical protein FWD40_08195 [Treponema sp.]|nr:hypothetical protein [Treponema sp.]
MKKITSLLFLLSIILIITPSVFAQSNAAGSRGQSINGSTGLFSIPSGHIGWDSSKDFGFDIGYRAVINSDRGTAHLPAVTISIFKIAEISAAFDIQPQIFQQTNEDLLLGFKAKLPTKGSTAVAIGGNVQLINLTNRDYNYNAYQPYAAVTYTGNIFNMAAETTIAVGKTFFTGGPVNISNIDFGMGFDIILFPDVFGNAVHWITDFANFGYSDNSWPNDSLCHSASVWRGILNTGFRLDVSAIPALNQFKFLVDLIFNDLFDAGTRSFTAGLVFGLEF